MYINTIHSNLAMYRPVLPTSMYMYALRKEAITGIGKARTKTTPES